ncbi:MAG TPA: PLP-dependent aspartate aminotransferase family protein [Abditibacteriaceae bacterium]|jgi:cystathionine gamma-synthase/methionine-gamma-lyase
MNELSPATQAVHAGETDSLNVRPSITPIYATTTFLSEDMAQLDEALGGAGFVYSRHGNPTVAALEKAIATLENAFACVAFGSGQAALHGALLACNLKSGDCVLIAREIYGASHTLIETFLVPLGVKLEAVDVTDNEAVRESLSQSKARVLVFEPLSNPLIKVADVQSLCELARQTNTLTIVDATFTPPPLLRVLDCGADFALHSATKYFGGHGDATGGVVSVRDENLAGALRSAMRLGGAILSPFEAFLMARGLKTLVLRLREQCRNAAQLAHWLSQQKSISRVFYPGLSTHPQHQLTARLLQPMSGENLFGAMLAFEVEGAARDDVFRFMDALRLIKPATTLGDVQSEVSYPPIASHRGWSDARMKQIGLTAGVVRFSAGIEDVNDIIADLQQAFNH